MSKLRKSARKDGRGHWPHGKRRHDDLGSWSRVRLALARLLDARHHRGVVSIRALASVLGVADRSVRRWLAGIDRPHPDYQASVVRWITILRRK